MTSLCHIEDLKLAYLTFLSLQDQEKYQQFNSQSLMYFFITKKFM